MLNKELVIAVAKEKLNSEGALFRDKDLLKQVKALDNNLDFLEAVEIICAKLSAGVEEKDLYKSFVPNFTRTW